MNDKKNPNFAWMALAMIVLSALACAQDCMGSSVWVRGYVVNIQDEPVVNASIEVWNDGSFELPAISLSAQTDSAGWFVTDSAFSYGCTPFQVRVSAEGYETKTLTFYPPSAEGFPDELLDELTIQLNPTGS
ncbi:MAG: carboxypeptidase regulatory-like domain-containing protein [Anaerolinea sp.]|nr:carboxypeptidase regulatory-like domain-containing protein [Anaerolinea sp.]